MYHNKKYTTFGDDDDNNDADQFSAEELEKLTHLFDAQLKKEIKDEDQNLIAIGVSYLIYIAIIVVISVIVWHTLEQAAHLQQLQQLHQLQQQFQQHWQHLHP